MNQFLNSYFSGYSEVLQKVVGDPAQQKTLDGIIALLKGTKATGATIYIVGNGGSAAVAEHMAIDLTQNAKLKALAVSGSPMLTCWANDYGYEHCFRKAIQSFAKGGDVLIAISSSGTSKSIINACAAGREKEMTIVTLSGFEAGNPLRTTGDYNLWVDSRAFGYVELIHNLLLHYVNDAIIGNAEYMIRD